MRLKFLKSTWLVVFFLMGRAGATTCETAFDFSGLFFKQIAVQKSLQDSHLHPHFRDPLEEQNNQAQWNKKPDNVPASFNRFLPEGVHFIDHRLIHSESLTSVKIKGIPGSPLVRASYEYAGKIRHTNVLFSSKALLSNIFNPKGEKWLASPSAQAVILFLHGMGRQTAGAHIAMHIGKQFKKNYKRVEVLALDLPFHGEGPRSFLNNLKEEVLALSAFAKKYIPPHVPLVVMAHSGGTVFAEQLMSMTDGPEGSASGAGSANRTSSASGAGPASEAGSANRTSSASGAGSAFFHPSLKGVILFSPIVDSAPGKSPLEKYKAFSQGQKKGLKEAQQNVENDSLLSPQPFESQNPVGELYFMWNIVQWDAHVPDHKGSKYVPALMALGTNDSLIWAGFPKDLFHGYYDKLSNMETHYLEKLPLLKTNRWEKVEHDLGNYKDPASGEPLQLALARPFIERQLGVPLSVKKIPPPPPFVQAMALFSHDLTFRAFLPQYFEQVSITAYLSYELRKKLQTEKEDLQDRIHQPVMMEKNKIKKRINGVLQMESKEQALDFVRQMELPENMSNEINQAIRESPYFDLKSIADLRYVPSKTALLERGLVNAKRDGPKVDRYLAQLAQKSRALSSLKKEIRTLNNRKNQLVKQKKLAQTEVEDAIFLVERAIKQADKEWPPALKESFGALKRVRDQAQQARAKLIAMFEETAPRLVLSGSSTSTLEDLLSSHQQAISEDKKALSAYQQARQDVQRQVIQAILQGEIGNIYDSAMYQKAGQDLYGPQFDIYKDKNPQGDLYVKLQDINQQLAKTESSLHKKRFLFEQGIQEYQDIFGQLNGLIKPFEEEGLDLMALAEEAWTVTNVREVLQAEDSQTFAQNLSENSFPDWLKDYNHVFHRALTLYQKLQSDLMPPLPGIFDFME